MTAWVRSGPAARAWADDRRPGASRSGAAYLAKPRAGRSHWHPSRAPGPGAVPQPRWAPRRALARGPLARSGGTELGGRARHGLVGLRGGRSRAAHWQDRAGPSLRARHGHVGPGLRGGRSRAAHWQDRAGPSLRARGPGAPLPCAAAVTLGQGRPGRRPSMCPPARPLAAVTAPHKSECQDGARAAVKRTEACHCHCGSGQLEWCPTSNSKFEVPRQNRNREARPRLHGIRHNHGYMASAILVITVT